MVAVQQLPVAEVEPEPGALDQHLGQGGDIAEAEIQPLAGDGVDGMGRVADQRQPLVRDPRRVVKAQRIGRARRQQLDAPEEAAHGRLRLGRELGVGKGEKAISIVPLDRPDDRRAMAATIFLGVIVGHRQQSERARGIENLPGDMVVRPLMAQDRDDRRMVILPAGDADSRRFAGRRMAPLGGNQQRRRELAAVLEPDRDPMLAPLDGGGARLPAQVDIGPGLGPGLQRCPQMAVLVHPAERLVVALRRLEGKAARLQPVGDANGADLAAGLGETGANADRVEHPPRGGGDGAGAPVEAGAAPAFGIDRVDDDAGQPAGIERGGKRQADQPAAEDNHVRASHGVSLASPAGNGERGEAIRQHPRDCFGARTARDDGFA